MPILEAAESVAAVMGERRRMGCRWLASRRDDMMTPLRPCCAAGSRVGMSVSADLGWCHRQSFTGGSGSGAGEW